MTSPIVALADALRWIVEVLIVVPALWMLLSTAGVDITALTRCGKTSKVSDTCSGAR